MQGVANLSSPDRRVNQDKKHNEIIVMKMLNKALLATALLFSSFAVHAGSISLLVSDQNIRIGDSFTIDLMLETPFDGLFAGDTLFGFGYDLNHDTGLSFDGYTLADGWDDDSAFYADTDIAGSHFPGIDDLGQDNLLLTQLGFTALNAGNFSVDVMTDSLTSFNQGLFYLWEDRVADFSGQVRIDVRAVPAPATGILFLSALGLLSLSMRKKHRRSSLKSRI